MTGGAKLQRGVRDGFPSSCSRRRARKRQSSRITRRGSCHLSREKKSLSKTSDTSGCWFEIPEENAAGFWRPTLSHSRPNIKLALHPRASRSRQGASHSQGGDRNRQVLGELSANRKLSGFDGGLVRCLTYSNCATNFKFLYLIKASGQPRTL